MASQELTIFEPINPLLPTISKSFSGLPTLGPILETGPRRALIGWNHKKDTPEGLLTGRLWCWVSEGASGGLQVCLTFPYLSSQGGECSAATRSQVVTLEEGMHFARTEDRASGETLCGDLGANTETGGHFFAMKSPSVECRISRRRTSGARQLADQFLLNIIRATEKY